MKDASNAQVMNLMKELDKEQKKHKELQASLTEKTKAVTKAEAQCRSLENEKLLFETEQKVILFPIFLAKATRTIKCNSYFKKDQFYGFL